MLITRKNIPNICKLLCKAIYTHCENRHIGINDLASISGFTRSFIKDVLNCGEKAEPLENMHRLTFTNLLTISKSLCLPVKAKIKVLHSDLDLTSDEDITKLNALVCHVLNRRTMTITEITRKTGVGAGTVHRLANPEEGYIPSIEIYCTVADAIGFGVEYFIEPDEKVVKNEYIQMTRNNGGTIVELLKERVLTHKRHQGVSHKEVSRYTGFSSSTVEAALNPKKTSSTDHSNSVPLRMRVYLRCLSLLKAPMEISIEGYPGHLDVTKRKDIKRLWEITQERLKARQSTIASVARGAGYSELPVYEILSSEKEDETRIPLYTSVLVSLGHSVLFNKTH